LGAVVVMLIASATASLGTPAGGATVIVSPGWSGRAKPDARLSNTRWAVIGT
jgi:hypothetical protein